MFEEHTLYPTPANNLSSFSSSSNTTFPFPLLEHSPFTALASSIPSLFISLSELKKNRETVADAVFFLASPYAKQLDLKYCYFWAVCVRIMA